MAVLKDLIVHGASRFINGIQANTINAESIGANEGIFNKLIATTLDAKEATIEDLTATNATVVGLLDVQGQMQTNSWTNSNIATIDGSFYICPTISSEATVTTSGTTQTSNNKFQYNSSGGTIVLTGTWATTGSLYLDNSAVDWKLYSKVMVTGEVLIGTEWTPIGTIRGVLTGINTSGGTITIGSLSTNITVGSDGTINSAPAILSLVTSGTAYNARKLKVSLYEYNSAGTSSGSTNLIGIMMTTAGTHGFTYLDIYNGLKSKTSYTSTIDNITTATEPMVRIGNLNGLPNIVEGSTDASTKPTGWGIYTTNGFFKGKVVANAGLIGNWIIEPNVTTPTYGGAIYTGGFGTDNGIFITPGYSSSTAIGGSSGSNNWTITASNKFGVTKDGNLWANAAHIKGSIDATAFQARDSEENIRAIVDSDGLTVKDTEGATIASFDGAGVNFSSGVAQKIGGNETYIEFDPTTDTINMIGSNIIFGSGKSLNDIGDHLDELTTQQTSYQSYNDTIISNLEQQQSTFEESALASIRALQDAQADYVSDDSFEELQQFINEYLGTDGYINIITGANPYIEIGKAINNSKFSVRISSTEMGFYQNDLRVAYLNSSKLYITDSQILHEQRVGNFVWRNNNDSTRVSLVYAPIGED